MNTETIEQPKEFVIDIKDLDIQKVLRDAIGSYIDTEKSGTVIANEIHKRVISEVQQLKPTYVQVGDRKAVKIKGKQHKAYADCLFDCIHERQLYICGPAGSGKTTLAEQIAQGLQLPFGFISCSAGMSEAQLLGRMLFDGTFVSSSFLDIYEKGGVFLLDEIDAADSNTLLVINSALANGIVSVPNRKDNPTAKRHEDCIIIVSGNTWGTGSFEYQGRNHLDAAFLDRFAMCKVEIDYDKGLEKEITNEFPEIARKLWSIRENIKKQSLRRLCSTRVMVSTVRRMKAGKTLDEALKKYFVGWSKEEKAKALAY